VLGRGALPGRTRALARPAPPPPSFAVPLPVSRGRITGEVFGINTPARPILAISWRGVAGRVALDGFVAP